MEWVFWLPWASDKLVGGLWVYRVSIRGLIFIKLIRFTGLMGLQGF